MPDFLAEVLTWSHNYSYLMAVQTAVKLGLPPTSFVTNKSPSEGWSREDKKLAIAVTILERETCDKCGQPLWICRSNNRNLLFKTRKATCYAKAEFEKASKKKQNENLKPGEYMYVVPFMLDDSSLPSRREWLDDLAED